MPLPPSVDTCECGKPLDNEGSHLITCKIGGGVDQFGPIIPSAWSDCLNHVHLNHIIEPRHTYSCFQARPDIIKLTDTFVDGSLSLASDLNEALEVYHTSCTTTEPLVPSLQDLFKEITISTAVNQK